MPKKTVGREQTVQDVRDAWRRVEKDFPGWSIALDITLAPNDWFEITAVALFLGDAGDPRWVKARVLNTPRSPSFITDQWKALIGLYMQLERFEEGLPPLIGY